MTKCRQYFGPQTEGAGGQIDYNWFTPYWVYEQHSSHGHANLARIFRVRHKFFFYLTANQA